MKKGFIDEVYTLFSLTAAFFILALTLMIVVSFREKDYKNGAIAIVLFLFTGILLHLLGIVLKSLRAIAKLPLINIVNKLFGMAAGAAEGIAAAWIMYCIIQRFPTGAFGERIMAWTAESELLTKLYEYNYFAIWLSRFKL